MGLLGRRILFLRHIKRLHFTSILKFLNLLDRNFAPILKYYYPYYPTDVYETEERIVAIVLKVILLSLSIDPSNLLSCLPFRPSRPTDEPTYKLLQFVTF